ncbi:hypothetical protein [Nonomuraea wenchangensis]|uniref:hypothetical protein n=1 Tax=Nonomuraea wenchangensis TaxID=568860 RepID=UPI00331CB041
MPEPLTSDRLAEIRDLPYCAETHLLEKARVDLLAEVDRLNAAYADLEGQNALTEQHFADYVTDAAKEKAALSAQVEAGKVVAARLTAERDRIAEVREAAVREAGRERDAHDKTAAEVDRLRSSLTALVAKVAEDREPAYYDGIVPADILDAAGLAPENGGA